MINKRKLGDTSFIDERGKRVTPNREEYYAMKSKERVGKAYAFFDCSSSKKDIEKELPFIRRLVRTPRSLYLSLMELRKLRGEDKLLDIVKQAEEAGIKYAMEATYPDSTNHQTADELSAVLNQAYQS